VFAQTGFGNLGNTCFFNSILQCIMHSTPFAHEVMQNDHPLNKASKMQGRAYLTLKELLKNYWQGHENSIRPTAMKVVLGCISSKFLG